MYYTFFIIYLVVGFAATLWVFLWAVRNGQFKDQQRARFLPLEQGSDMHHSGESVPNERRGHSLFGFMLSGLVACVFVLVYVALF